ncbi:unnamed protein product, partial [Symbiodinium pilosum]
VLSRWPVEHSASLTAAQSFELYPPGWPRLRWYNLHLRSYPFAPYALHGFAGNPSPFDDPFDALLGFKEACLAEREEIAVALERSAQLPDLRDVLEDIHQTMGVSVIITGDFNAASHLDDAEGPLWPCSVECAAYGLVD